MQVTAIYTNVFDYEDTIIKLKKARIFDENTTLKELFEAEKYPDSIEKIMLMKGETHEKLGKSS